MRCVVLCCIAALSALKLCYNLCVFGVGHHEWYLLQLPLCHRKFTGICTCENKKLKHGYLLMFWLLSLQVDFFFVLFC